MKTDQLHQQTSFLLQAFLKPKTKKDVFAFLRDLLTEEEIKEFACRLDIAKRLHQGQNYKYIEQETGASSTTIARVAKFLKGEFGGYQSIFGSK